MSADRPLPSWARRLAELRRGRAWSASDLARELKKLRDDLPPVRSLAHMIQLDWETGKHRPSPRYRLLLAALYDADEHEIFDDQASPEMVPRPENRPDGEVADLVGTFNLAWGSTPAEVARVLTGLWKADIARRDMITSVWAAAALSEPLGRWLLDPVDGEVARAGSRQVGRADVDAVWAMCSAFADADRRLGGGHARRALICYADEVVAPLLAGRYTDEIGRKLFAAVARLCDIAGFMCFDSGRQGLGQKYFTTALRMTKTSGDQALGAHILTDMSMQAQHQQHAHEAVALAEASVAAASRSGSASTLARCHAVQARAFALQGDASDSDRALNQAEKALDRSVPRGERFWITFFTPQQLAAESMYAAAALHRTGMVRLHAANALEGTDGMQRRYVLATATLAASYLPVDDAPAADAAADVGQACEVLRGVLPVIGSLTSARALGLVSAVRSRLVGYPHMTAVQELERDLDQCMVGAAL